MANRPDLLRVGTGRLRSRWLPRHHPHQAEAGAGSGGPRPHAGLKARRLLRRRIVGDLPSP
jgi:hypothetical protein